MPKGVYVRKSHHKTGKFERSDEQKEILRKRFQEQSRLRIGKKRIFSDEWKRKMSESRMGKEPWNKGKVGIYSDECLKKIRNARKKQIITQSQKIKQSLTMKRRVSEGKCHLWKGGINPIHKALRKTVEYKLWRTSVFERDNFKCVICANDKSGNLEADHIKAFSLYPDLRLCINNGRTLCKECHRKTDTFGFKGNIQNRYQPEKKVRS